MSSEFPEVFSQLRQILQRHSCNLEVKEDSPDSFWVETGLHPKFKKRICVAGVKVEKNYVSFHLMPVYGCPALLEGFSKELHARKQGKACFNFKTVDQTLFREVDELTGKSIAAFRRGGFAP